VARHAKWLVTRTVSVLRNFVTAPEVVIRHPPSALAPCRLAVLTECPCVVIPQGSFVSHPPVRAPREPVPPAAPSKSTVMTSYPAHSTCEEAATIRALIGCLTQAEGLTLEFKELFKRSIMRPSKMLVCCPVVTILCTYVAILYGTLYLLFAAYSFVFKEAYGFSTFAAGLVFIAGGAGTLLGLLYTSKFSDRAVKKRTAAGNIITPEDLLPLIITLPGALTFPLGLFIYG